MEELTIDEMRTVIEMLQRADLAQLRVIKEQVDHEINLCLNEDEDDYCDDPGCLVHGCEGNHGR